MRIIEVQKYNTNWPTLFAQERQALLLFLPVHIDAIHHIGSTSVPGLAAKPIIDILIEVDDIAIFDQFNSDFELLGYDCKGEFGIAGRRHYQKGGDDRTYHIHVFEHNSKDAIRHKAFRDYLKFHPTVAAEYGDLKIKVADCSNHDIALYCAGKSAFIALHEKKALGNRPLIQTVVDTFVAPACAEFVDIVFEDEHILLINKPSGLLSLSGRNPLNWDSVHHRLVHGQQGVSPPFPEAQLPHRLDFGTSGIMVVGLNAVSVQNLNSQFEARTIKKRYLAVLEGWLADDEGLINAAIGKGINLFPRVKICHTTGKSAITEFKVLQRLEQPRRSVVQFIPHTGRTHQLRIHSQLIGHPILGCDLYSSEYSQGMADRLLLHASDLYFKHPHSKEQLHINVPANFDQYL